MAGHTVRLTSPDRVIFPERGFTKADVFDYYLAVGDGIMRALRDRPTTCKRFPDGIEGEAFFQKRVPDPGRAAVGADRADHASPAAGRPTSSARPTWPTWPGPRRWAPSCSTRGRCARADVDHPDELRIDLDPQPGTDFADAATAAGELRELLDELGWTGWPKTSGGRGVHVYLRIAPRWTFVEVRRATIALARELERRRPDLVTTAWWKEERGERVFVDYNQMARDRTIACAYSLRANARATVSTPVDLGRAARGGPGRLRPAHRAGAVRRARRPARRHRRRPVGHHPAAGVGGPGRRAPARATCPTRRTTRRCPASRKRVQPSKDRDRPRD